MDKYVDMSKLGAVCILVVEFIPIFIYTLKWGLEAARITITDPNEFLRENSKNSAATIHGTIRDFQETFFGIYSQMNEDVVMSMIVLQIVVWFIFLLILVYFFIPQIRALRGLFRKKPALMKPYFQSRIMQIQLWIILSILTGLTFLNVLFNKSYVVVALTKYHEHRVKPSGTAPNEKDLEIFRSIEKILFCALVVLLMITYLEYYLMSVVKLYYLRLKREESGTCSTDAARMYQRIAEDVV